MDSGSPSIETSLRNSVNKWVFIKEVKDRWAIYDLYYKNPKLSKVDCELILVAEETGLPLFTDDQNLAKIAEREFGIKVFDLESILLSLKRKKVIPKEDMKGIIELLEIKDNYLFKKKKKDVLLDC